MVTPPLNYLHSYFFIYSVNVLQILLPALNIVKQIRQHTHSRMDKKVKIEIIDNYICINNYIYNINSNFNISNSWDNQYFTRHNGQYLKYANIDMYMGVIIIWNGVLH